MSFITLKNNEGIWQSYNADDILCVDCIDFEITINPKDICSITPVFVFENEKDFKRESRRIATQLSRLK